MDNEEKQAERDERIAEMMREEARRDREFKEAVILLAKQEWARIFLALIDEMKLLRGALDRHR